MSNLPKATKYLVTTRLEALPRNNEPIIMVDGTVPGWKPDNLVDYHFDHHRPGGASVQIDEIPRGLPWYENSTFVTTQVDADACVAAAWVQIAEDCSKEDERKLQAIAWDCDHLCVPRELSDLADFAAQAVAALKAGGELLAKELGLPADRKTWSVEDKEKYASLAFGRGTQHLIDACKGKRKFPGEEGEAAQYWQQVETDTAMLEKEGRVTQYRGCTIINMKGLGGKYIDPRCALRVVAKENLPMYPITVTQREIYTENQFKGFSYTIGVVPLHPLVERIDYTIETFAVLTNAEQISNPNNAPWGGRKTVGGSGWNSVSNLTPQDVIDLALVTAIQSN